MKIGAQMYTVRDFTQTQQGLNDALGRVKAMGYDYVQLSGHNFGIPPEEIAHMLAQHGLEAPATHVSYDRMLEDFSWAVAYHKTIGAKYPGIGAMPERYQADEAGYIAFAKEVTALAEKFRDQGLTLIYHNHDFEFVRQGTRTGLDILLEECGDALQFELDTHWVQAGGGSPEAWIRKVAGRMDVLHLKDMRVVKVEGESRPRREHAEVGHGNLDWQGILRAAKETGVRCAFVEQDDAHVGDPFASLRMSREYLASQGL